MKLQFAKIGSTFRLFNATSQDGVTVEIVGCCSYEVNDADVWFAEMRQRIVESESMNLDFLTSILTEVNDKGGAYGLLVKDSGRILVVSYELQWYLIRNQEVFRMAEGEGFESFSGWCKAADELLCLVATDGFEFIAGMKRKEFVAALQEVDGQTDAQGGVVLVPAEDVNQIVSHAKPTVMPIRQPDSAIFPQHRSVDEVPQVVESDVKKRWSPGFLKSLVRLLPREDSIYLLQENLDIEKQKRGKRALFLISILLLLVLGGVVLYGFKERRERVFDFTFGGALEQIQYKITEGSQIAELNPVRARELIVEVEGLIQTLESRGFDPTELSEWNAQLQKLRGLAQRKHAVEPTVWLSLDLVRENLKAKDVYGTPETLYVLDVTENRLVGIDIDSKAPSVIASQDTLGTVSQVAANSIGEYVVGDKGLMEVVNKKVSVIPGDIGVVSEIKDLQTYGSNIYVLSNTGVWRWSSTEESWSGPDQWLEEETLQNWVLPKGSGIDGMVWLATGEGVRKYIRGVQESFNIQGLEESLVEADDLYTDEETSRLYILDKGSKRVVVVDKESGIYELAYTWDGLDQVIGIHVNEELKKMWWVTAERIYEVGIR